MDVQRQYAFRMAKEFDNICQPLLTTTNTQVFQIIRSYYDGGFITLSNSRLWLKNFFTKEYYKIPIFRVRPNDVVKDYILVSSFEQGRYLQHDVKQCYGICSCILLVKKYRKWSELYLLAGEVDNASLLEFCINNLERLNQLILYTVDKARILLEKAELQILQVPEYVDDTLIISQQTDANASNTDELRPDRYYIDPSENKYLTRREVDCIYWLSLGKTSEEISLILGNSKRTVEALLNSSMIKLDCRKATRLVIKARELGFI